MTQTREIDGVLYEITPFYHERWVNGDYDMLYHKDCGVLIELQFFNSIEQYMAVVKEADCPSVVGAPYIQLLKTVKEEYRYMNVYGNYVNEILANGAMYFKPERCYESKKSDITFKGITKYTLVNGEIKSAEFIPKDKVEEMLKDSDN